MQVYSAFVTHAVYMLELSRLFANCAMQQENQSHTYNLYEQLTQFALPNPTNDLN